jgi:hypothetical protein
MDAKARPAVFEPGRFTGVPVQRGGSNQHKILTGDSPVGSYVGAVRGRKKPGPRAGAGRAIINENVPEE